MIYLMVIDEDGQSVVCQVYDKHFKKMLFTSTQILGRERGEDAVHDVFVKIIEKFEKNIGDLCDKPGRYFVIIVRNHSINILKKERMEATPIENIIEDDDISDYTADGPEEVVINDDAEETLTAYIRRLSPTVRQAFEYRYIEGYSNIEIAGILGITQSAVSTKIERARKRLKEMIESERES